MSMQLKDHSELVKACEKYQQFNHDERLRALDEAHQRYLHDLATDIEAAHIKGRHEGRVEILLRILARNFGNVPPTIRDRLLAIHDIDVLGHLTDVALNTKSQDEFENVLKK